MVELTAQVRKEVTKRGTSALRREFRVPAVLYARGQTPIHLSVDQKEFLKMVRAHRESGLVNLTIQDGEASTQQQAIYKKVNTLYRRVNHVDFQAIRAGEKIHIKVAIVTKGTPLGVSEEGGVLVHTMSEVEIRVLPDKIPEQIEIDVTQLKIGDAIHLKDIVLPDVEIHHDLESIVASVTHVREEKAAVVAPVEGEVVAGAEGAAAPAAAAGAAPKGGPAPKGGAAPAAPAKKEGGKDKK
jgi:large subunit ribosomal protein L25